MAYCTECGQKIDDGIKFCPNCGASTGNKVADNSGARKIVNNGAIHKCPNCGEVINSFTAKCPTCGYEFRGTKVASAVRQFADDLSHATSTDHKVSIIRSFPIPNTKEDIFEFMLLASSNISGEQEKEVFDAWNVKFEQSYQKAKIVIHDEADIQKVQEIYDQANKQIKREKRKQSTKAVSRTLSKSGGGLAYNVAILAGKSLAIIGGLILYIMAINTYNKGGNGSGLELFGAILLIASAATLVRRNASMIEYVIGALSGVLSIYMARFLDNGSMLELTGGVVLIIVAVNFFRGMSNKSKQKEDN